MQINAIEDEAASLHSTIMRGVSEVVPAPAPPSISSIGFPTCNRPTHFRKCLESYLENAATSGRSIAFLIVDDSRSAESEASNRKSASDLAKRYGADVRYANRASRLTYANTLSRCADVSPDLTRFALLGRDCGTTTNGAGRNTLLLETAGELTVQTDDDTVCHVRSAPDVEAGLLLSGRSNPQQYWFSDHLLRTEPQEPEPHDFFEKHEALLGQYVSKVVSEFARKEQPIIADAPNDRFVDSLNEGVVLSTFNGVRGDACVDNVSGRIFLNEATFKQVIQQEHRVASRLRARDVLRSSPLYAVTQGSYCISMTLGLDNRGLLPPFMPMFRSHDGSFGILRKVCYPEGYNGFVPYTIDHESDRVGKLQPVEQPLTFLHPRINYILIWMIGSLGSTLPPQHPSQNLTTLGDDLVELAEMPLPEFIEYATSVTEDKVQRQLSKAERLYLATNGISPSWSREVQRYIEATRALTETDGFYAPTDLDGTFEERFSQLQTICFQFGELLRHWPVLVDAARHLKEQGVSAFA